MNLQTLRYPQKRVGAIGAYMSLSLNQLSKQIHQSRLGFYLLPEFIVCKNGALGGTRTRSATDLNRVCLPISPPGR